MIARNDMNMTSGLVQNGLRTSDSEAALDAALASPRLAADLERVPGDWRAQLHIYDRGAGGYDIYTPDLMWVWDPTLIAWVGGEALVLGRRGRYSTKPAALAAFGSLVPWPGMVNGTGSHDNPCEPADKSGCTQAAAQREGDWLKLQIVTRERDAAQKLCVEQARKLALYEPRAGSMDMDRPAQVQISLWLTITRDDIHVGENAGEAAQRLVADALLLPLDKQKNTVPPKHEISVIDWQYTDGRGE